MSQALDTYFRIGERIELGTHEFTADEIVEFAREFDPQDFHVDAEKAAHTLFGGLCASGWHTCAMWMRYNCAARERTIRIPWHSEGSEPEFGPSPGFRNLRWVKPAYAGDRITFFRTNIEYRPVRSRPGWIVLTLKGEAVNQNGDLVLEMENAVLVRASLP